MSRMDALLEQEPELSVRCTLDTRRYICEMRTSVRLYDAMLRRRMLAPRVGRPPHEGTCDGPQGTVRAVDSSWSPLPLLADLRPFEALLGPFEKSTRIQGRAPGRCLPPRKHRARRAGRRYQSQRRLRRIGTPCRCGGGLNTRRGGTFSGGRPRYQGGETTI